jgi:hypothetical protein
VYGSNGIYCYLPIFIGYFQKENYMRTRIYAVLALLVFVFTACGNGTDPKKTLVSIAVTTQPTQTEYEQSDTTLNLAGMVVTATYSDGSTEAVSGYTTSGFNVSTPGNKTITVSYKGKTATFIITVNSMPPTPGLAFTLINDNAAYSVSKGDATATEIIIPSEYEGKPVTAIAASGFYYYEEMTRISIPSSITNIDYYAFEGCIGLTGVTIPDSVTSIGERAFYGCRGLTSITIPNGVTSIGNYAFDSCNSLSSVFYGGTDEAAWSGITIGTDNTSLITNATRYYYSETQPAGAGSFWHWVGDEPTGW